jgi:hypothetical protein
MCHVALSEREALVNVTVMGKAQVVRMGNGKIVKYGEMTRNVACMGK